MSKGEIRMAPSRDSSGLSGVCSGLASPAIRPTSTRTRTRTRTALVFYVSTSHIGDRLSTTTVIEKMLCAVLMAMAFAGDKLYLQTSIQDPKSADLRAAGGCSTMTRWTVG